MQKPAVYFILVTSKINLSYSGKSLIPLCCTHLCLLREQLVLRVSEPESFIFLSKSVSFHLPYFYQVYSEPRSVYQGIPLNLFSLLFCYLLLSSCFSFLPQFWHHPNQIHIISYLDCSNSKVYLWNLLFCIIHLRCCHQTWKYSLLFTSP